MSVFLTPSRIRWAVLALIYASFLFWYGGDGDPLTAEEVAYYVELAETRGHDGGGMDEVQLATVLERVREFALADDGKEYVAVNLNLHREKPVYQDGRAVDPELTSQEAEDLYIRGIIGELLSRASHPLVAVEPIMTVGSTGDFEVVDWSAATFVRYRSRADFLSFLLETEWNENAAHKFAALEKNQHMPAVAQINLVMLRTLIFLALACLGLVLDRVFGTSSRPELPG